jgi:F-type H+-transporting ATPase subunit epsilon
MAKLSLKIVTPSRIMFDGEADMVIMRTKSGDVGILHGHQPMVTVLDYGVMKIQNAGEEDKVATVFGGFAEINSEGMSILTDVAEWADEIDVARAEAAKERAERRLANPDKNTDTAKAELALRRAITRLGISGISNKK